jgi:hypothetical protein
MRRGNRDSESKDNAEAQRALSYAEEENGISYRGYRGHREEERGNKKLGLLFWTRRRI